MTSEYDAYDRKVISDIASLAAIAVNNASLIEQSSTDAMTKLKLKHFFFNVLADRIDETMRTSNSLSVIKASFRAAKRNNSPIYFATTLNQVDNDGGYTGMTQAEFTKILAREAAAVNYTGPYVVAIDHGGPWLKDKQTLEKYNEQLII